LARRSRDVVFYYRRLRLAYRLRFGFLALIISHGAFGIELEWLNGEGEPTLSYRFRAEEEAIGTADVERSLACAHADVTQLLRYEGQRGGGALFELPSQRLLRQLQVALLVDFDFAVEPGLEWDRHLRFLALPLASPAFMGWSAFLVETQDAARLVWAEPGRHAVVREQRLAPGDFDAALREFRGVLTRASRQSVPPHSGERIIANVSGQRRVAT